MASDKRMLLREIKKQSQYPSGGDPFMQSFFKALTEMAQTGHPFIEHILNAQNERSKIKHYLTKSHAVYLPLHIINYLMIFREGKTDYPYRHELSLSTPRGWKELVDYLMGKYEAVFKKYLMEKDVQQNIYQRGITIPFLMGTLLHKKRIAVTDLGCSANFVWGFIMTKMNFEPIVDDTSWGGRKGILAMYSQKKIEVEKMNGLDRRYPLKDEEGKKWLIACRHPKEVTPELIAKTKSLIETMEKLKNIQIQEGNFLNPPFEKKRFDIVTMNNTLYQLPDKKRMEAIKQALLLLNPKNGLLVIQDNCRIATKKGKRHIVFTDSRKYFTYRSCIGGPVVEKKFKTPWLEIFKFKSTRCRKVRAGRHFIEYMDHCNPLI